MSKTVIKVENLSKLYRLGVVGTGTLKHDFNRWWAQARGKEDPYQKIGSENNREEKTESEYVWSLRNLNFEIKEGQTVGIIGKNGAGKSTLLKVLSRITSPTTGSIKINGKIASLLEVGTGFHPELTGRENIFLNGAIMGMSKQDISKKLDEIIHFSGVDKYVDTPVKRYSSGMYVRLAFSVAAHLNSDILIVDEVLAVGDAVFQTKCIDKMTQIAKDGRTVLFVSHNLGTIKGLCERGILLENGNLVLDATTDEAVERYAYGSLNFGKEVNLLNVKREGHNEKLIFENIKFKDNPLPFGQPMAFSVKLKTIQPGYDKDLDFGIIIKDKNFNPVYHFSNRFIHKFFDHQQDEDEYHFEIENNLKPGTYYFNLYLSSASHLQDWLKDVVKIEIADGNPYKYNNTNLIKGVVLPKFDIKLVSSVSSVQ